jgi:hypothetical protein
MSASLAIESTSLSKGTAEISKSNKVLMTKFDKWAGYPKGC